MTSITPWDLTLTETRCGKELDFDFIFLFFEDGKGKRRLQWEDLGAVLLGEAPDGRKMEAPVSRREDWTGWGEQEGDKMHYASNRCSWRLSESPAEGTQRLMHGMIQTQQDGHVPTTYTFQKYISPWVENLFYFRFQSKRLTFHTAHSSHWRFPMDISAKIFRIIPSSFEKHEKICN